MVLTRTLLRGMHLSTFKNLMAIQRGQGPAVGGEGGGAMGDRGLYHMLRIFEETTDLLSCMPCSTNAFSFEKSELTLCGHASGT